MNNEQTGSTSKTRGFKRTIREAKNRRSAILLIGADGMNALEANGLRVVPIEHADFLYHAAELEALGLDLEEELRLIRADP